MTSLNLPYTRPSMRRRYESWFLRFGTFEVVNNILAQAQLSVRLANPPRTAEFATDGGAVLEMSGAY